MNGMEDRRSSKVYVKAIFGEVLRKDLPLVSSF